MSQQSLSLIYCYNFECNAFDGLFKHADVPAVKRAVFEFSFGVGVANDVLDIFDGQIRAADGKEGAALRRLLAVVRD